MKTGAGAVAVKKLAAPSLKEQNAGPPRLIAFGRPATHDAVFV